MMPVSTHWPYADGCLFSQNKLGQTKHCWWFRAVCDETQNLNETESETFFRYQFFSILFSIPIFFRYRYRYFFRYQNFTKPIPILFSIPNFFETDTDTFFDTKKKRNRYQYFYWYQKILKPIKYRKVSKPIPILFSIPKYFETDTIKKQPCSTLGVQNR